MNTLPLRCSERGVAMNTFSRAVLRWSAVPLMLVMRAAAAPQARTRHSKSAGDGCEAQHLSGRRGAADPSPMKLLPPATVGS